MKRKFSLLLCVFCLSLIGACKLDRKIESKIVFETQEGPVRMTKKSSYREIINNMEDISCYSVELLYEPYTRDDFIEQYGYFNQNFFREMSRIYHTNNNLEMIKTLGIEDYVLDISNYSPFIYLDVQSMKSDKIYDFAYDLARNVNVEEVFVSEDRIARTMDIELEPTINSIESLNEGGKTTTTPRIAYDNYPADCTLTGNGVKIGILDPSSLDVTDSRLSTYNNVEVVIDTVSSNDGGHGLAVALVLGTQYGIASGSSIYFADVESRSNMLCLENLIDAGCDVVNMSFGYLNSFDQVKTDASLEGYIDYMHNSTGVIMVAASGNGLRYKSQEGKIPLPAAAANVIAVGSHDGLYLSEFSSCNILDEVYSKPEIVAKGQARNINAYGYATGTSFSAPAVTGTIALLLEGSSVPLNKQQITALLTCSADPDVLCEPLVDRYKSSTNTTYVDTISVYNTFDSSTGLYKRAGAGKLDITKAIETLSYYSGYKFCDLTLTDEDFYILGLKYLTAGQTIKIAVSINRIASTYWLLGTKYKSEDMPHIYIELRTTDDDVLYTQPLNTSYFASVKTITYTTPVTRNVAVYLYSSEAEAGTIARAVYTVS